MIGAVAYRNVHKSIVQPHESITVVADREPSSNNTIRLNETLQTYTNTFYAEPVSLDITQATSQNARKASLVIEDNKSMQITVERTTRMPDDNKLHQLPLTLGRFELHNVESYADLLPENIRETGGVFLSMWQREAMWISLKTTLRKKYAIRVLVGHINAISGLAKNTEPDKQSALQSQDYLVVPGQDWLDGICMAPGIVRQFVAMPCKFLTIRAPTLIIRTDDFQWALDTLLKVR